MNSTGTQAVVALPIELEDQTERRAARPPTVSQAPDPGWNGQMERGPLSVSTRRSNDSPVYLLMYGVYDDVCSEACTFIWHLEQEPNAAAQVPSCIGLDTRR